MEIRRANERGQFENDWLKSAHSFSFADYFDPRHIHFHDLRVINEDEVQPGSGFPTHGHRDMEIITYVYQGTIEHKDSMGNKAHIHTGEIQVMSAGKGVLHSEYNPNSDEVLKLLQIWVVPQAKGLAPGYQQREFSREHKLNQLCLIAAPNGADGALSIRQDLRLYAAVLEDKRDLKFEVKADRAAWLQLVKGKLTVNDSTLLPGDGLAVEEAKVLELKAQGECEFLLFDLAKRN